MKYFPLIILLLFSNCDESTQEESTEYWDNYIAIYEEDLPGSTVVRMDIIEEAPIKDYTYVLIINLKYETSREDQFPEDDELKFLQGIEDEVYEVVEKFGANIPVGSFTGMKEREIYFYIKEKGNVNKMLDAYFSLKYPELKYEIELAEDINWERYTTFLYPNEATRNYMSDRDVVRTLQEAGDPLTQPRRVDHWAYFSRENEMNEFQENIKAQKFDIVSAKKEEDAEGDLPYTIQFWREDFVYLDSIYTITSLTWKYWQINFRGNTMFGKLRWNANKNAFPNPLSYRSEHITYYSEHCKVKTSLFRSILRNSVLYSKKEIRVFISSNPVIKNTTKTGSHCIQK